MYPVIFEDKQPEESDNEGGIKIEAMTNEKQERFNKYYGWQNLTYILAGNDATKVKEVLDFNVHFALNMLQMIFLKDELAVAANENIVKEF